MVLQTPAPPPIEVAFRTIGIGSNGAIKDGGAVVLRTAAEFDEYRAKMKIEGSKKPKIRWGTEQVIALHAAGVGYGLSSLNVRKVRKKADGSMEVEATVDKGSLPPVPTPGVIPVLRKEGIYAIIVTPPSKGAITLRIVDPPRERSDTSGRNGSR